MSNQLGLDATTVCRLFKMAALVIIAYWGSSTATKNDALNRNGLTNILGSIAGDDFQNKKQSFFNPF